MSLYNFPVRKKHYLRVLLEDGTWGTMVVNPTVMGHIKDIQEDAKRTKVVIFLR